MRLSKKKAAALYGAIHETIMKYRIDLQASRRGEKTATVNVPEDIDRDMFLLTNRIHAEVEKALEVKS